VNPPAGVFIGDIGNGTSGIADLAQAYPIDADYFDLELRDFSATHPERVGDGPGLRVIARAHATRTVTMSDDEREMLHRKMLAFWTFKQEKK
jgi:hypothetical protein